jgi:hypothetical protein
MEIYYTIKILAQYFQDNQTKEVEVFGHVECMEQIRNIYKILVGKFMERDHVGHESLSYFKV